MKQPHPLVALRRERHLKQRDLAELADVSEGTVSRIERGWIHDHPVESMHKIAQALGVPVHAILAEGQIAESGLFDAAAVYFGLDPSAPSTRAFLEHGREVAAA